MNFLFSPSSRLLYYFVYRDNMQDEVERERINCVRFPSIFKPFLNRSTVAVHAVSLQTSAAIREWQTTCNIHKAATFNCIIGSRHGQITSSASELKKERRAEWSNGAAANVESM